jgi:hypothetical protein
MPEVQASIRIYEAKDVDMDVRAKQRAKLLTFGQLSRGHPQYSARPFYGVPCICSETIPLGIPTRHNDSVGLCVTRNGDSRAGAPDKNAGECLSLHNDTVRTLEKKSRNNLDSY